MKAFRWLIRQKNDPMIEKADSLIRTANSIAESAFGLLLKAFPVLQAAYSGSANQPDYVDRVSFMITIACVFVAVEGLRKADVEETRRQAVIDRLETRLLEWNAADSVAAFEHCKNYVNQEFDERAKAGYDPNHISADAVGSWVVSDLLNKPPTSEEERRLVRSVGTGIAKNFGKWWT